MQQHPWVLRNLASPASWLRATDPARTNHVTITDEDVQHATQERGAVDTLPPIRNRPGIRRALNAALAKFPAFSRIKSTRTTASTNSEDAQVNERDPRTRSKSNSSAAQSIDPTADSSISSVSRHPSDAGGAPLRASRGKFSHDGGGAHPTSGSSFGSELRRIISGGHSYSNNDAMTPGGSSPGHYSRGGWGAGRRKLTPTNTLEPHSPPTASTLFPELARTTSTSSVHQSGSGRSSLAQGWFQRRPSDSETPGIKSPVSSLPSPGQIHKSSLSPSPYPGSDTETSHVNGKGSGTLSRMLSRIAHGHIPSHASSGATSTTGSLHSRSSVREREDRHGALVDTYPHARGSSGGLTADGIDPAIVEQLEAAGTTRAQYDSLGRLISARKVSGGSGSSLQFTSRSRNDSDPAHEDEDGAMIDLTEFEYSDSDEDDEDDEDELDELRSPPLAEANYLSGWQPTSFGDFRIGVRSPSDDFGPARGLSDEGSPLGTPPTDELGPLEGYEEDGKIGPKSTASAAAASRPVVSSVRPVVEHVPFADTVSFQLCPIDFDESAWTVPPAGKTASETPPSQVVEGVAARRDRGPFSIATSLIPPGCERHDSTQSSQASQSPRDGSIRGLSMDTPPGSRKTAPQWEDAEDGDGEEEEEEMLVVPRRRRAATLSGSGQATPQR